MGECGRDSASQPPSRRAVRRHMLLIATGILCFLTGALATYAWMSATLRQNTMPSSFRTKTATSTYAYIDPLLFCGNGISKEFTEFSALHDALANVTAKAQAQGTIMSGSVYFRDLTDGRWAGINENDQYTPASLLKVPILIAYFKAAETNPALLTSTEVYQQEPGQAPPLIDMPVLVSGHSYTVEDVIRGMIVDSDNTAKDMLESGMNKQYLSEAYAELGIPSPYSATGTYQISTRTYAMFFRVLYNATFLTRDLSEKALAMLAEVKFDKGLRAGTPAEVPIAHKYGFFVAKEESPRVIELSDCGIVYVPDKPYLLCVMARGSDPDVAATYIRDIASTAYRLVLASK